MSDFVLDEIDTGAMNYVMCGETGIFYGKVQFIHNKIIRYVVVLEETYKLEVVANDATSAEVGDPGYWYRHTRNGRSDGIIVVRRIDEAVAWWKEQDKERVEQQEKLLGKKQEEPIELVELEEDVSEEDIQPPLIDMVAIGELDTNYPSKPLSASNRDVVLWMAQKYHCLGNRLMQLLSEPEFAQGAISIQLAAAIYREAEDRMLKVVDSHKTALMTEEVVKLYIWASKELYDVQEAARKTPHEDRWTFGERASALSAIVDDAVSKWGWAISKYRVAHMEWFQ